jgi:hypothetical protein
MRHKAEIHVPGSVSKVIRVPEVNDDIADVSFIDPAYGKLRIVNFLVDEMGKKLRLKAGDGVSVVIGSDEVEPNSC